MNWIIQNGNILDIPELAECANMPQISWSIKIDDEYMDVNGTMCLLYIHNKIMENVDWEQLYITLNDRMITSKCFYIVLTNTTNILYETVEKLSSLAKYYQACNIFLVLYTSCLAPLRGIYPYCQVYRGDKMNLKNDDEFRNIIKKHTIGVPEYDLVIYNHIYRFMEIIYEEYHKMGVAKSVIVDCIIDCLVGIRLGQNNKSFVHIQHLFNRLDYERSCLPQVS